MPDSIDQLLEAIAENPEALELRWLLADRLQEQGDPRGELMALELSKMTGMTPQQWRRRLSDADRAGAALRGLASPH